MNLIFNMDMYAVDSKVIVVKSVGYESIMRHSHSFVEVVYIESGSAIHTIDDAEYCVKDGDFLIIADSVEHNFRPTCREDEFNIINVIFSHELIDTAEFLGFSNRIYRPSGKEPQIILRRVMTEYEKTDNYSQERIIKYVEILLKLLLIEEINEVEKQSKMITKRNINDYIESAIRYMHDNYSSHLTVSEIAAHVGLQPAYLQKLFRDNRKTSMINHLLKYRIEMTCKYLLETDMTIEKIYEAVGFSDLKNFYRSFKELMQLTPTQYRLLNKKTVAE